jgi:hypothetical protein
MPSTTLTAAIHMMPPLTLPPENHFQQILLQVRLAAASMGYPSNALLEQAFRLAKTPEMEREVEEASWPRRAPGETAKLLEPLLWNLDDDDDDNDNELDHHHHDDNDHDDHEHDNELECDDDDSEDGAQQRARAENERASATNVQYL